MFSSFVICSKYSRTLVQPITENSGNFSRDCKLRFPRLLSRHKFSRAYCMLRFPCLPLGHKFSRAYYKLCFNLVPRVLSLPTSRYYFPREDPGNEVGYVFRACRQVTSFPALTVRPAGYKLFSEFWLGFFAAFYKAQVVNIN